MMETKLVVNAEGPPPPESLGFGKVLAPYVVRMDHHVDSGWGAPRVLARADDRLSVATGAVQYGMSVFEGLKAFRGPDGGIALFRPIDHARRLRRSAVRLCLPDVSEEQFVAMCSEAARANERHCPPHRRGSLYFRPTLYASEEAIGLRPSPRHVFDIVVSPSSDPAGAPLRLWAEEELVRAAPGGLGAAKTGANYAASLFGAQGARARGYDDVLWLDGVHHRFLNEAGTTNVFVVLEGGVVTPPLDGTILQGITRDSCLALLGDMGIPTEERPIGLDELVKAGEAGTLLEVFGAGTAARIAPVVEVGHRGGTIHPRGGEVAAKLRRALADIQDGIADDPRGWRVR